jgi:hypothetical protein
VFKRMRFNIAFLRQKQQKANNKTRLDKFNNNSGKKKKKKERSAKLKTQISSGSKRTGHAMTHTKPP